MNYPTITAGLALAPRGIASMFSMMLVGRLINRVDPRLLITAGVIIFSIGSYQTTQYTLVMSIGNIIVPMLLQGMGLGMVFIPLSTLAFSTLPPRYAAEAAGMYSLLRTIGSGVGISLVAMMLTRHAQIAWHDIGAAINPYNPALPQYLEPLHLAAQSPQAAAVLTQELARQSQMVGFVDAYWFVAVAFAAMLPLVFLMKVKTGGATPAMPVE